MCSQPATSVWKGVLAQNVQEGMTGARPADNWAAALYRLLTLLLPHRHNPSWSEVLRNQQQINLREVRQQLQACYKEHTHRVATTAAAADTRTAGYFQQVCGHDRGDLPAYLRWRMPWTNVRACLAFRLGLHYLRVQSERVAARQQHRRPAPLQQRYCLRCPLHKMDTELHCLLECTHPDMMEPRARFLDLALGARPLGPVSSLSALFQLVDSSPHSMRLLVQLVAVCHRTVRAIHQHPQHQPRSRAAGADTADQMDSTDDSEGEELVEVVDSLSTDSLDALF